MPLADSMTVTADTVWCCHIPPAALAARGSLQKHAYALKKREREKIFQVTTCNDVASPCFFIDILLCSFQHTRQDERTVNALARWNYPQT